MANLKKRFNEILEDMEKNIKNKEDLDYIKSQVYNISLLFLDELDKLAEINLGRLNVMLDREKELAKKISRMEKVVESIEKEVLVPAECDFEIICPYCNTEFVEEFTSGVEHEVKCPECGNSIELDWNEDDDCCGHNCSDECDCEECIEENEAEIEEENNVEDDDM